MKLNLFPLILQFSCTSLFILFGLNIVLPNPVSTAAPFVVTYRSSQSESDTRNQYDIALLNLALEGTKDEFGEYELTSSGRMNTARAIQMMTTNERPNFFVNLGYESQLNKNLIHTNFPLNRGILGYRICFISPQAKAKLPNPPQLSDLKQLVHGQGTGWSDISILRSNGFQVVESSSYEGLFLMVANNHIDLFCRGVNELHDEFISHKHIRNLTYDETFALVYPLPRFFYTNKENNAALERVNSGLKRAYEDGSLLKLWQETYQKSLDFSQLDKRTLIYLENPNVRDLDIDYKQYFYLPETSGDITR